MNRRNARQQVLSDSSRSLQTSNSHSTSIQTLAVGCQIKQDRSPSFVAMQPKNCGTSDTTETRRLLQRSFVLTALAGLLVSAAGCDLGTYDQRAKARLEFLNERSAMSSLLRSDQYSLLGDAQGQGTGVSILHPILFADPQGYLGADQIDVEPKRVIPPGIPLPGLIYTHEWFVPAADGTNLACYMYHCVLPNYDENPAEVVMEQFSASVANALPDATLSWETVELPRLSEGTITWQCLKLVAGQEFAAYNEGDAEIRYEPKQGQLWLCLYSTPQYHIVLGWRFPAEVNDSAGVQAAAEACMGSLLLDGSANNTAGS